MEWHDFFVAEVGSSAALAGLLFVGISINLAKILTAKALPNRALADLGLLLGILLIASLMLVPGQSNLIQGIEVLLIGGIVWGTVTVLEVRIYQQTEANYRSYEVLRAALTEAAALPYVVAGILLVLGNETGIYWLVPAFIFSFIKVIFDAWVLLVEINR